MNIANSLYTKNEVIARPTLAAVDRLPSVFFSGGNYSIKVVGSAGGSSLLVDKQTGVALSITPTFVDDEHVMINVRASRSFREESPDSNIALNLTRNTVNAAALIRFGQTFVLNGLIEREKDQTQNFTPILGEIPVLQYFFKRQVTIDFNRQILTLITVRKLVDSDDSRDKAKLNNGDSSIVSLHKLSDEVDEFMKVQNNKPVLDEVLAGLKKDNFLFQKLSRRDLIQESYGSKNFLDRIIGDLKDMLYF
jgi:type II secretory pathway component GspD/PulD (secretin)